MKYFFIWTLFFLKFNSLFAEGHNLFLKTDLGMSSSYHAAKRSDILNKKFISFRDHSFLKWDLLKTRAFSPTFVRFYDFVETITDLEYDREYTLNELQINFYNPDAASWEGLCDKWSAAAIDKKVINLLNNYNNGAICGNSFFSYGELKEILSFIYPFDSRNSKSIDRFAGKQTRVSEPYINFFGEKKFKPLNLPSFSIDIRNSLGIDDLDPEDFNDFLYNRLFNNEGVIVDLNFNHKIRNFPVTSAHFEKTKFLILPDKYIELIPPELFKITDNEINDILNFIIKSDKLIKKFIGPFFSIDEITKNKLNWKDTNHKIQKLFIQKFSKTKIFKIVSFKTNCDPNERNFNGFTQCFFSNEFEYTKLRKKLFAYLKNKNLELSKNIDIYLNKTTLHFNTPGSFLQILFGKNYDLKEDFWDSHVLEYLTFERKGKVLTSWITKAKERPDFAWTPNPITKSVYPWQKALLEIYDNINYILSSCVNMNKIFNLLAICRNKNDLSDKDILLLKEDYKRVKNFLNPNTIDTLEKCF